MEYRIQELKLGGVLDQAISLTKNHFGLLFTIMALVYIPATLVMSFVQQEMLPPQPEMGATEAEVAEFWAEYMIAFPVLLVPLLITGLILLPLANAAVVDAVARLYLGKSASAVDSLKTGISKILPLLGTSFLVGLVVMGGLFLFFIPGIIFMLWFMLATHVVVIESIYGPAALGRSRQLMRGNMGTIFVLLLVLGIIGWAVGLVAGVVPQVHVGAVLQVLLSAITTIFGTAAMVVFYFSCRCGHENFDLEYLARQMGESASADATEGDAF